MCLRDQAHAHAHATVLGVAVSALDMQRAVLLADDCIRSRAKGYICVTGVHGIMEAQSDTTFLSILNGATINLPDGMPLTWIGRLQGFDQMDRVYGPTFMLEMCKHSVGMGYKHFFFGGQPGVAQLLGDTLAERFEGLRVVGSFTPPFRALTTEEEDNLLDDVRHADPDIIWVGLSTPKQERFMAAYRERLNVPLLIGVGAAFDINTGHIKDAPMWMKRVGFQWFHRLLQEPKRLGPRYLKNNPRFLFKLAKHFLIGHL
jgi:N-acetylglucosaminyldiphosphoundecaprenol N-acetyl-beta-D-mannosaminyltransferase